MSNLRYYAVYTPPPRVNRVSPPFMLVQHAFLCASMHSSCRALQSPPLHQYIILLKAMISMVKGDY